MAKKNTNSQFEVIDSKVGSGVFDSSQCRWQFVNRWIDIDYHSPSRQSGYGYPSTTTYMLQNVTSSTVKKNGSRPHPPDNKRVAVFKQVSRGTKVMNRNRQQELQTIEDATFYFRK